MIMTFNYEDDKGGGGVMKTIYMDINKNSVFSRCDVIITE